MKIMRWRAARKPTREEVELMFMDEGLDFQLEEMAKGSLINEHKHPFDEIRMVIQGSLRYNVAGNEFILREGDRIDLPSNTRHWTKVEEGPDLVSIIANRVS